MSENNNKVKITPKGWEYLNRCQYNAYASYDAANENVIIKIPIGEECGKRTLVSLASTGFLGIVAHDHKEGWIGFPVEDLPVNFSMATVEATMEELNNPIECWVFDCE